MNSYDFMELYQSEKFKDKEGIITIGVFDGVHKGHIALINRVLDECKTHKGAISMVITFSTNPKPGTIRNVDTIRLREKIMEERGINSFVVIDFSSEFSKISASGFLEMLTHFIKPRVMVVGEDFRLGNPKESASAYQLQALLQNLGIECEVKIEKAILTEGGEKISSTLVRRVIEKGEMGCIPSLTGRNYQVDLLPCPFKLTKGVLEFCRLSIHQLLPPPGVYETTMVLGDSLSLEGKCEINESSLLFIPIEGEGNELLELLEKDKMQPNSIFIGEKK